MQLQPADDDNGCSDNRMLREAYNLSVLKERLEKSAQIAHNIDGILMTFENRLSRLENTILPVYNETENLQKTQQNIEVTLQLLDNVIAYYNVSSDVEAVVERGPTDHGASLDHYLRQLDRLAEAQRYFEQHIPQSVELENVSSLFLKGSDRLNAEFKLILDKYNVPMPAVALQALIGTSASGNIDHIAQHSVTNPTDFPHLPDKNTRAILVKLATWLSDNGRDEYLTVYGKLRGAVVQRSLALLRSHQKSSSGGSAHAPSSPMLRAKFQSSGRHESGITTGRRPSTRRISHALEKKSRQMFLKASQTLEHSTGLTLGARRSSTHLDVSYNGEELDNEQELENYLQGVMALHRLMQLEQMLMREIVGASVVAHQPRVFELIVRESMDSIVQEGEAIAGRARKCMARHDFGAVLLLFPILKQLRQLKPDFERTVQECDLTVKSKFDSILTMLHGTSSKALEDFIESLRTDSISQLPSDGTVHELTSNVLMFLEQLLDYTDTIGTVLAQDLSYSRQLDKLKFDRGDSGTMYRAMLGLYIKKVLVQLNHTLISKSEQYGDAALKAIFRLNNNNYVLKALQRGDLLQLYRIAEPNCEQYYYTSIQEHKRHYLNGWNKLLTYIAISDNDLGQEHRLRDKERTLIKERFAGFNKEIEDLGRVQRGYSIPDVELRETIKRDNKEIILPRYNAFYNTFAGLPFTKNPEKYIKHKPDQVAAIIDRLFDVAA